MARPPAGNTDPVQSDCPGIDSLGKRQAVPRREGAQAPALMLSWGPTSRALTREGGPNSPQYLEYRELPPFSNCRRPHFPSSTDRVRVGSLLKGRWIPLPQEVTKIQPGREARRTPGKLLPGTPGVQAQCAYAYCAFSPSPGHGQQSRDFPDPQGSKSAGQLQAQGLSWCTTEMV